MNEIYENQKIANCSSTDLFAVSVNGWSLGPTIEINAEGPHF